MIGASVVAPTSADPFDQLMSLLRAKDAGEVVLAGSAGTGKTTMIKRVVGAWGASRVTLLAPTGKAARRITEATGYVAATLHSTIYGGPGEDPDGNLVWKDPQPIGGGGHLVVIDETSMVGLELATDVRVALVPGTVVLWVGDPHQLPPVGDAPGVDLQNPHVRLTRVHRSGDGIMALAYAILGARTPPDLSKVIQGAYQYPGVYQPKETTPQQWRAATMRTGSDSMMITYQNKNRHALNFATRAVLDYPESDLVPGEPLVVMSTNKTLGLANGELLRYRGHVPEPDPDCPLHLGHVIVEPPLNKPVVCYTSSSGFVEDARMWREARREDLMSWRHRMGRRGELRNPKWLRQAQAYENGELPRSMILGPAGEALHMHFAYALTCHKMQGSEAENIGVVWAATDPVSGAYWSDWWSLKRDLDSARAWWYTAVTRARKNLILWM